MELAQAERKTRWITLTREELLAKHAATETAAHSHRQGVALAEYAGRPDLMERFAAKLDETRLTLNNLRWALEKLSRGETY